MYYTCQNPLAQQRSRFVKKNSVSCDAMGYTLTMAVMLSAAAMSVGQWVDPIVEEEVHYKPSRFHRYEAVGLTADEKAGE